MKKAVLLCGAAVALNACASLSPEECKTADWARLGYADAMKGDAAQLPDYVKDCAKAGVTPDPRAYMGGYDSGAKAFCTYEKGVEVGEQGRWVADLCNKPGLAEAFNQGLAKGKKRYEKQQEIDRKEDERNKLEQKLKDIKDGKAQSSVQEVDLLYREKELVDKEIDVLKREKDAISP